MALIEEKKKKRKSRDLTEEVAEGSHKKSKKQSSVDENAVEKKKQSFVIDVVPDRVKKKKKKAVDSSSDDEEKVVSPKKKSDPHSTEQNAIMNAYLKRIALKTDDWACADCGQSNFGSRSNCRRCHTDKPAKIQKLTDKERIKRENKEMLKEKIDIRRKIKMTKRLKAYESLAQHIDASEDMSTSTQGMTSSEKRNLKKAKKLEAFENVVKLNDADKPRKPAEDDTSSGSSTSTETPVKSKFLQGAKYDPCDIFIPGITSQLSHNVLKKHFSKYGEVENCVIKTGKSDKGTLYHYCVIKYSEESSADAARAVGPQAVQGINVDVRCYFPPGCTEAMTEEARIKQYNQRHITQYRRRTQPFITLSASGQYAQLSNAASDRKPLLMVDLRSFIYHLMIGEFRNYLRWCRIVKRENLSHIVLIAVEGVTVQDFLENQDLFPRTRKAFDLQMELISPTSYGSSIVEEMSNVPLSALSIEHQTKFEMKMDVSGRRSTDWSCYQCDFINFGKNKECKKCGSGFSHKSYESLMNQMTNIKNNPLRSMFPYKKVMPLLSDEERKKKFRAMFKMADSDDSDEEKPKEDEDEEPKEEAKATKLGLMMDIREMVDEGIPVPLAYQEDEHVGFVMSCDAYQPATNSSPMYGIDCEMVFTSIQANELAEVSVVDEQHNVVYYSLVKPSNPVRNYLTEYSGITEHRLANVTTTLQDVQTALRKLLPPDVILVGHSIVGDLKALKLFHPHIIDTSCLYQLWAWQKKSKLQLLSKLFLNEEIQMGTEGHDPTEDALATLKLAQLKLQHAPSYGNVNYGGEIPGFMSLSNKKREPLDVSQAEETADEKRQTFFRKIHQARQTVCIVCHSLQEAGYSVSWASPSLAVRSTKLVACGGNKHVANHTCYQARNHNFTIAHMDCTKHMQAGKQQQRHVLRKLDKRVHRMFKACAPSAVIVLALAGRGKQNGVACLTIKDNRI